jgi:phage shock protein PspC (stress-responsive transcriptional regulator)
MKTLYKSISNKKIFGVCGGLANYLNIDATFIRLVLVLLTVLTAAFPGILVYLISTIIIPDRPEYEEIIIEKDKK